jgi:hypothetical protein
MGMLGVQCASHENCEEGKYCDKSQRCLSCGAITPDFCQPIECDTSAACISRCCGNEELMTRCSPDDWPMIAKLCPSAQDCGAIARGAMVDHCHIPLVLQTETEQSVTCTEDCAELWLTSLLRCKPHRGIFEAAGGAQLTHACNETVQNLLATAANEISISGFECHRSAKNLDDGKLGSWCSDGPTWIVDKCNTAHRLNDWVCRSMLIRTTRLHRMDSCWS